LTGSEATLPVSPLKDLIEIKPERIADSAYGWALATSSRNTYEPRLGDFRTVRGRRWITKLESASAWRG